MKKSVKRMAAMALAMGLVMTSFAGCGGSKDGDGAKGEGNPISVISREDGSGTRGAFIELFGIEEKNDAGEKIDNTTLEATTTNSTSVMMTTVAGDVNAIGYISMGSMNETVKAVKIDGVEATTENVENGTYKVARPFNITTKGEVSPVAQDFVNFIMSKDGQTVIVDNGYISVGEGEDFVTEQPKGKVVVSGSSSVGPVMDKLKEAYAKVNPNASVEVQSNDSSTGMSHTIDGICDIGMASRELKATEIEAGLTAKVIAMDGIAVIVNNDNPVNELSSAQVKDIFTGAKALWDEITK